MDEKLLEGLRVLVVEDEMLVLMAIEDLLADLGCTAVSTAANVDCALSLIAAKRFDLATLDVNLNGQRSYPIAQALRESGVPFAFSTGYGDHGVDEGHGNRPVLKKPYSRPQFNAVMATLVAAGTPPALAA